MSKLSAFLNPVLPEEREVVISKRFVGEDGKPVPFRIRALTQEENDAITKKSKRSKLVNGQMQETLDASAFTRNMILAATVEPNFADTQLCERYGVLDPSMVPGKMLLSGEYAALVQQITDLCGFSVDLEEEVKN